MRSSYNGCSFTFPITGALILNAGRKESLTCFATSMIRGAKLTRFKRCPTMAIKAKSIPPSNIISGYKLENLDPSGLRYSSYSFSEHSHVDGSSGHFQIVKNGIFRMVASLLLDCIVIVTSLIFGMVSLKTTEQLKIQLDEI